MLVAPNNNNSIKQNKINEVLKDIGLISVAIELIGILIISTEVDLPRFKKLLGDGSQLGVKISYNIQKHPNGIAESFIIGEDFIGSDNVCLILGDNIFHGKEFTTILEKAKKSLDEGYSSIFGVEVENPNIFGVIEFDKNNLVSKIIEKPKNPKSNIIVSGLYFYTNEVVQVAKALKPSKRGEKEITDVNNYFLKKKMLKLNILDNKTSWVDTGTYSSLIKASKFFEEYENDTGNKVACIEEIAYQRGYINKNQLKSLALMMKSSDYGKYLLKIACS